MRKYYAHQTMRFDHFAAKTEFTQFRVKKKMLHHYCTEIFCKNVKNIKYIIYPFLLTTGKQK